MKLPCKSVKMRNAYVYMYEKIVYTFSLYQRSLMVDWERSQLRCQEMGGHLITINHKLELNIFKFGFVFDFLNTIWVQMYQNDFIFIGLKYYPVSPTNS